MSNKTHAKTHGGREQKRDQFSKPARRNGNFLLWLVIVGLLGVVGYLAVSRLRSGTHHRNGQRKDNPACSRRE